MLEALHPGRIDLGLGRAPGTDPLTARRCARARPAGPTTSPSSSATCSRSSTARSPRPPVRHHRGARARLPARGLAARLERLQRPGRRAARPAVLVRPSLRVAQHRPALELYRAVPAVGRAGRALRDDRRPRRLRADRRGSALAPGAERALVRAAAQGRPGLRRRRRPPTTRSRPTEREIVRGWTASHVLGAPEGARQLDALAARTGADELMITTMVHGHADRLRSYELLAEAMEVTPLPDGTLTVSHAHSTNPTHRRSTSSPGPSAPSTIVRDMARSAGRTTAPAKARERHGVAAETRGSCRCRAASSRAHVTRSSDSTPTFGCTPRSTEKVVELGARPRAARNSGARAAGRRGSRACTKAGSAVLGGEMSTTSSTVERPDVEIVQGARRSRRCPGRSTPGTNDHDGPSSVRLTAARDRDFGGVVDHVQGERPALCARVTRASASEVSVNVVTSFIWGDARLLEARPPSSQDTGAPTTHDPAYRLGELGPKRPRVAKSSTPSSSFEADTHRTARLGAGWATGRGRAAAVIEPTSAVATT